MSKFLKLSVVVLIAISAVLYKSGVVFADAKIGVSVTPDNTTPIMVGGLVTYNYLVSNLGTSSLTDIALTDDKCGPVKFVDGDLNSDKKLDKNEVWKYTCKANLNRTTTNTATATGKLDATTTSATATSTVVVTVPDRSIKVIKTATPEKITANSGQVVYLYEVTNPGLLALGDVTLSDDECDSINLANGDINSNGKLEPAETWRYTCNATLSKSTTSVATVRAQADNQYVTDVTTITVLVGKDAKAGAIVPKTLPKAGGGGAAKEALSWSWLLVIPPILLGIINSKKKTFKKSYLGN